MKQTVIMTLAFIILAFMVYTNLTQTHSHEEFFSSVHAFMNKGGRNTSDMGEVLCERLNAIEVAHELEPTDCKEVYLKE